MNEHREMIEGAIKDLCTLMHRQIMDTCTDAQIDADKIMLILETARRIIGILTQEWRLTKQGEAGADSFIPCKISIPTDQEVDQQ